jgi:hypothetical protein
MTRPIFTVRFAAFATFCGLNLFAANARADLQIAFDSAADAAYDDGWQDGDNGGFGFSGWGELGISTNSSGHFVFDSSANGFAPSGNINTAGRAWGMYANNGATSTALRGFDALLPGQTFSIAMDNGLINPGGVVGFSLIGVDTAFTFSFAAGDSNYMIDNSIDTGFGFTDDGFTVALTLTSETTYDLAINGDAVHSGTFSQITPVFAVRLFNSNAGPDPPRDIFFNALSITAAVVPEAGAVVAWSLLAGGCIVASFLRRSASAKVDADVA